MCFIKSESVSADTRKSMTGGFKEIIINILLCFVFTLFWLVIFAVIITYTNFPDRLISPVVVILTVISIMLAAFLTARRRSTGGWHTGALTGILYMMILYCIGSIIYNNVAFGANTFAMFLLGILSGMFGGILGVNLKKK